MKIHVKKKAYKVRLQQLAKEGFINNENGVMIKRSTARDNSMKRDYYPQGGF